MERDDIIEYSLDAHHSEETGKKIRKNIVKVTIILTIVTTVEVLMGVFLAGTAGITWEMVKITFIVLTLVKAGYIVMEFMHLGDERKTLRYTILAPYALFILYLLFILVSEASALYGIREAMGLL